MARAVPAEPRAHGLGARSVAADRADREAPLVGEQHHVRGVVGDQVAEVVEQPLQDLLQVERACEIECRGAQDGRRIGHAP